MIGELRKFSGTLVFMKADGFRFAVLFNAQDVTKVPGLWVGGHERTAPRGFGYGVNFTAERCRIVCGKLIESDSNHLFSCGTCESAGDFEFDLHQITLTAFHAL